MSHRVRRRSGNSNFQPYWFEEHRLDCGSWVIKSHDLSRTFTSSIIKQRGLRWPAFVLNCFSRVWLFATLQTVARQAPLSLEFSRKDYWSGLPCPSPGDLPDPGIELVFPALQVDSLASEPPEAWNGGGWDMGLNQSVMLQKNGSPDRKSVV